MPKVLGNPSLAGSEACPRLNPRVPQGKEPCQYLECRPLALALRATSSVCLCWDNPSRLMQQLELGRAMAVE